MKVAFISNYFNHHQKPFSDEMNNLCDEYIFVATSEMGIERKKLGYVNNNVPAYVRLAYKSEECATACREFVNSADAVIIGAAPNDWVKERIKNKKIVFRYAERPLKEGIEPIKYFPRLVRWRKWNPHKSPIYMLCASAYTASDYAKFGLFKNKTYKWGYFPETKTYDVTALLDQKSSTEILWCGRFIDWKHPDDVIKVVARLKQEGYSFKLKMIGRGDFENVITSMISEYDLSDCVELLGSMAPERVRCYMEKAGVFLFTSDKKEGWGAVLNEAMNSGCAVVSSRAAGATPFLVRDGENGIIYESENVEDLYKKVKYLLDHSEEQKRLGRAAYHTIIDEWNGEDAARRFVKLAGSLHNVENIELFVSGPCSKANIKNKVL